MTSIYVVLILHSVVLVLFQFHVSRGNFEFRFDGLPCISIDGIFRKFYLCIHIEILQLMEVCCNLIGKVRVLFRCERIARFFSGSSVRACSRDGYRRIVDTRPSRLCATTTNGFIDDNVFSIDVITRFWTTDNRGSSTAESAHYITYYFYSLFPPIKLVVYHIFWSAGYSEVVGAARASAGAQVEIVLAGRDTANRGFHEPIVIEHIQLAFSGNGHFRRGTLQ